MWYTFDMDISAISRRCNVNVIWLNTIKHVCNIISKIKWSPKSIVHTNTYCIISAIYVQIHDCEMQCSGNNLYLVDNMKPYINSNISYIVLCPLMHNILCRSNCANSRNIFDEKHQFKMVRFNHLFVKLRKERNTIALTRDSLKIVMYVHKSWHFYVWYNRIILVRISFPWLIINRLILSVFIPKVKFIFRLNGQIRDLSLLYLRW